jgi:hypothetical protein
MLDSRPSHETEMRLKAPGGCWRLTRVRDKSAIPWWNDVRVHIDNLSLFDASGNRYVREVIDRLD